MSKIKHLFEQELVKKIQEKVINHQKTLVFIAISTKNSSKN